MRRISLSCGNVHAGAGRVFRRLRGRSMTNQKHSVPPAAIALVLSLSLLRPCTATAQGTPEDYARSAGIRELLAGKVVGDVDGVAWSAGAHRFS